MTDTRSELVRALNESLLNESSLENFILSHGTALTSPNLDERTKGIETLAGYIELLSPGSLGEIETEYLTEYLISRLSDHHSFIPIIAKSLLHLSRFFPISNKQAISIFTAIHREVANQQLPIQERFIIYQLIGSLFSSHLEAFKSINNDFLYGFIQIMEGERDPRCLLLCFDLFNKVVSSLSLGHLEEEIFAIVSCYFPIVYNPTKEKGIQITRDDLHEALKKCFMASSSFAPFAYLLFVEKLESDVESAKLDAYDMIISCTPVYGKAVSSFLGSIWSAIRFDILRINVNKISEKATQAMITVLLSIKNSPELSDKFLKEVLGDLDGALNKLSLKLFGTAIQFLATISACCDYYMKKIGSHVLPILMKNVIFDHSSEPREFLEGFNHLFRSWKTVQSNDLFPRIPDQEILLTHLLSLFDSHENHIRLIAVECLYNFVQCPFKWESHEEQALAHGLLFLTLSEPSSSDDRLRNKIRDLLSEFSAKYPDSCQKEITQNLLGKLPDSCDLTNDDLERLLRLSEALKCCLQANQLAEDSSKKIANLAVQLFYQSQADTALVKKVKKSFAECTCQIINSSNLEIFSKSILSPILKLDHELIDENLNEIVSKILQLTSSSCKICIFENFLNSLRTMQPSQDSSPSSFASSTPPTNLSKVIECIICNSSIDFSFSWIDLIQSILRHILSPDANQLIDSLAVIIEVILNKSTDQGLVNLTDFLDTQLNQFLQDTATLTPSIRIIISCNRGLVIRGGEFSNFFTNQLLNLMQNQNDELIVSTIAKNFVPFHQDFNYYNHKNGFNISPFYTQKYFYETCQPLLKGYNESTEWRKRSYALCLLNHLKNLPKTVIRDEINKFQSLTIFNLEESNAPANQMTALDCLNHMVEAHSVTLIRNISGIINRLLELSKASPYLEIRRKSLDCLTTIAKTINEITLLPYRPLVLHSLKSVLDDRKRIVRYACTVAKHHWTLIGQPV
ncbi:MMS19 nucleotide excision repair protein homolog [Tetranychus urticae]|uniref:MMS19 nucleotide excision repair protein n=1 Tax=Tetranychus urticae TaxID=32264 RepID=T1K069_TETUR|nr:MMS19 nucleotide excision repair protein homolog [Tetranychus urticae]